MGGRLWKQHELDYLRENLGILSVKDIATNLKRTEQAIIQMAYNQGISEKLNFSDKDLQKLKKRNNGAKRSTYQKRKDEGLCTRCGKRWAEAGRTKCRPCRERDQKWYQDNNMRERLNEYKRQVKAERRENGLCLNCGKPLEQHEKGVNTFCERCRKSRMERTSMARLRMRIHGIKRKR